MDWRQLEAMRPFVEGLPMMAENAETRLPNSCSTDNNLTVLAHWFEILKPERTLEIGLAFGASATLLLSLHQLQGRNSEHHAIDPFQRSTWSNVALKHIESSGLSPWFRFHERLSAFVLPDLVESGTRFDLIYIDGSHLFEDVFVDFYFCQQLLTPGGILAFDDSASPHVRKVLQFIRHNFAAAYEEHSPYLITSPSHAKLKQLTASLLGRQQLTVFQKKQSPTRDWSTPLQNF